MKQKRIFIGTCEIGNQTYVCGEALRQMGHDVHTVVRKKHKFYSSSEYSEIMSYENTISILNELIQNPIQGLISNGEQLMKIRSWLTNYDIYIFHFGCSILGGLDDLQILKKLGKKVICIFHGSDINMRSVYEVYCNNNGLSHHIGDRAAAYPKFGINEKLRLLRLAELYADAVFSVPSVMTLSVKPYFQLNIPVDISNIRYNIPQREIPIVIHAPSNSAVKGTDKILNALNELKNEGIKFDFKFLEKTDNDTIREQLSNADIAIDQLYAAMPATFALEAMAAGCAVICGNRPHIQPLPIDKPCVGGDPKTIKSSIKKLIINKSYRFELASKGRDYVSKWHDPKVAAASLLEGLTRSLNDDYDYYPSLFIDKFEQPNYDSLNSESKKLNISVLKTMKNISQEKLESLRERKLIPV